MRRLAKVATVLFICVPGLPACQSGGTTRPPTTSDCSRLAPFVVNPNGGITRAELETALKAEFKKWDKDGNGELSPAEVRPLNAYLISLNIAASPVIDWNNDGKVDFQEFAGGWRTIFDLCDRDNDGVVPKAAMDRTVKTPPAGPASTTPKP